MANIQFINVSKTLGDKQVLEALNCTIETGLFTVILGPSGCGKSTLLRLIAGLDELSTGTIAIDGRPVNDTPPKDRGCAMVFQNYALYPHMNVADNLGYSLKLASWPKPDREQRVAEVARLLNIAQLLERKPHELSGGQRQRVAIGRAIARNPSILLLDEPLSNLDPQLRAELRVEFRHMHERLQTTTVYVTHDQAEAMTLADRIIVLNEGRIEQIGTPDDIYRQPASTFVARFIGTPPMNLLQAQYGRQGLQLGDSYINGPRLPMHLQSSKSLILGIRPEQIRIVDQGIEADVAFLEKMGSHQLIHCRIADQPMVISTGPKQAVSVGDRLSLAFAGDEIQCFSPATGLRIETRQPKSKTNGDPWPVPGPIIAHRGASRHAPENTLPAFEKVSQFNCNWVEVDVKLTADRQPVLFHDNILDRVTTGSGPLANLTLEQVMELDVGSHFSDAFKGTRIPHLREALHCILDCDLGLVLELKPTSGSDRETAIETLNILREVWPGSNRKLLITSASAIALWQARDIAPEFRYGLSALMPPSDPSAALRKFHCSAFHCDYRYLTESAIQRLVDQQIEFAVATVNDKILATRLLESGATGIISDIPNLL